MVILSGATTFTNCTSNINVSLGNTCAGAFIQSTIFSTILFNCTSVSNISTNVSSSGAGGFMEDAGSSVTITNCSSNCILQSNVIGGIGAGVLWGY